MDRCKALAGLAAVALLAVASIGLSQTTYEDPQGRFVIDLPAGWKLKPVLSGMFKNELVSDFDADGKNFSIAFNHGINDPDRLIKHAASQFRFLEVEFDGEIVEMAVNGHSARWGILKTALDPGMVVLCGSIELGRDGAYLIFTIRVADLPKFKDRIERAFQSLRLPGEELTGVDDVRSVKPPSSAPTVPTPWEGESIGLVLPPGWSVKPIPRGFEKEVKGWFLYEHLAGVNAFVACYGGMGMTLAKAFDAGTKSVTIPMPGLKPAEHEEIVLGNGKAHFAVYKGPHAAGGAEVEVASVIVSMKAAKGFANLIVTGQAIYLDELKAQALEIAKTVK
jgi:hypothetical protein